MIVHSHPSTDKEHQHSTSELILIAHLSAFETYKVDVTFLNIDVKYPIVNILYSFCAISSHEAIHLKDTSLRAPPIILSL